MSEDSTPNPESREAPANAPKPKPARVRKSWTVAGFRIKKPYPDFPLTPHATGTWQKKIRGRIYYFGRWARVVNGKLTRVEGDGWEEALEQYKAVADDLHAGRPRRVDWDSLTVAELCNRFLTAKLRQREAGELGARTFDEYKRTTDYLVGTFGKTRPVGELTADDFEKLRDALAKQYGPVRLGNEIVRVRGVFKYGYDSGLFDKPVGYGPQFKKPSAGVLRRHRAKSGERMLEAAEVRRVLDALAGQEVETGSTDEETGEPQAVTLQPDPALRAMVLLGINAGFGNADVGSLPLSALDMETGWVDYPRPKTGIPRRCPLWPETVQALREALTHRPEPKNPADAGVLFLEQDGRRWVRNTETSLTDRLTVHFTALMKRLGIHRQGLGFYTLRHVFRTVADAARDPVAIDLIMGHTDPTMGGHYRERVEDSRLQAVAERVRQWLLGAGPGGGATEPEATPAEDADQPRRDAGKDRPKLRLFAG
jgi:integrase